MISTYNLCDAARTAIKPDPDKGRADNATNSVSSTVNIVAQAAILAASTPVSIVAPPSPNDIVPQPKIDNKTKLLEAIKARNTADVRRLSAEKDFDLNVTLENDQTPLALAIDNRDCDMVRVLMELGAKLDLIMSKDVLELAAKCGNEELLKMLIAAHPHFNLNTQNISGETALMLAAKEGHKAVVQILIRAGANLEIHDVRINETALMLAAQKGHEEIVQVLIAAHPNLDAQNIFGETALLLAAKDGHKAVVQMLINARANLDIQGKHDNKKTALICAAQNGHEEIAQMLIDAGADLKCLIVQEMNGICGLDGGQVKINGKDISLNEGMEKGLGIYIINDYLKKYFKTNNPPLKKENVSRILDTFSHAFHNSRPHRDQRNDANVMTRINNNDPVFISGGTRKHCVGIIIYKGTIAICNRGDGSDEVTGVNFYIPKEGITEEMVKKLLISYVDMTEFNAMVATLGEKLPEGLKQKSQKTSNCVIASDKSAVYALAYMLEKENAEDFYKDFTTFMRLSCYSRCKEKFPELATRFEKEKLPNKFNPKHRAFKHFLAQSKQVIQNFIPASALAQAAKSGDVTAVQMLFAAGSKINDKDESGETALMQAVKGGHKAVVQILINNGANLDIQDVNGVTALMLAALTDCIDVVEILIRAGANLELLEESGKTALMLAALLGHHQVVKMLIEAHAKLDPKDKYGNTALMWAQEMARKEVEEILAGAIAKRTGSTG